MLVNFYLLPALSGQQTDLPHGSLTFDPVYAPPYSLPVLLQGVEGPLTCAAAGTRTVALALGRLQLPAGGLAVAGVPYPHAVALGAGQSVSW